MTCLIQLLSPIFATWWRLHGCWWRQKRIIHIWHKVGPLVSIHCVRCFLPNPNCFSCDQLARMPTFFARSAIQGHVISEKQFGLEREHLTQWVEKKGLLSVTCVWSPFDVVQGGGAPRFRKWNYFSQKVHRFTRNFVSTPFKRTSHSFKENQPMHCRRNFLKENFNENSRK